MIFHMLPLPGSGRQVIFSDKGRLATLESIRTSPPEGAKAQRVYLALRENILDSTYQPGQSLPGEQKLAKLFQVSRVTVRRALDALCDDKLIEKQASIGTVVRDRSAQHEQVSMDFSTLLPQVAEMGRNTSAQLLSFSYEKAPQHVAQALKLADGSKVQIATRVRSANNQPFSHLTTYVPENIACNYSEQDLATTPLFELLERSGVEIDNAYQSVSASLASPTVADALKISVGAAVLSLRRVVRDSNGNGVEYLSARYRPDLFRLDMTLTRVRDGNTRSWEPSIAAAESRASNSTAAGMTSSG